MAEAETYIGGFQVAVDNTFAVDELEGLQKLLCEDEDSSEWKFFYLEEYLFQTGTHQLHYYDSVVLLQAGVLDVGDEGWVNF